MLKEIDQKNTFSPNFGILRKISMETQNRKRPIYRHFKTFEINLSSPLFGRSSKFIIISSKSICIVFENNIDKTLLIS